MKIRKNDMVMIISGNDRGKTGKVLKVFPKKYRIIVEGINLRKRHTKPNQKNPQGGILEKEAPVHASNVMILDPKSNEPTRIGSRVILDEKTGKKKRKKINNRSQNQSNPREFVCWKKSDRLLLKILSLSNYKSVHILSPGNSKGLFYTRFSLF